MNYENLIMFPSIWNSLILYCLSVRRSHGIVFKGRTWLAQPNVQPGLAKFILLLRLHWKPKMYKKTVFPSVSEPEHRYLIIWWFNYLNKIFQFSYLVQPKWFCSKGTNALLSSMSTFKATSAWAQPIFHPYNKLVLDQTLWQFTTIIPLSTVIDHLLKLHHEN